MRLTFSRHSAATTDLVLALEAPATRLVIVAAPIRKSWRQQILFQWSIRPGGPTDQIRRNTASERVLRRPREPEPHSAAPFRTGPAAHR
jgi:hypothetical protein